MPLDFTMSPDHTSGECEGCGCTAAVTRFFVEAGNFCGYSPYLCSKCLVVDAPRKAQLDEPVKDTQRKPPSRQRRKAVQQQEREMATLIGGRTQKASGAMLSAKGDVRRKGVLRGEMKSTVNRSFSLKREVLDKIRSECVGMEKPFLALRFVHPHTLATEDEWVIIPIEQWEHGNNAPF